MCSPRGVLLEIRRELAGRPQTRRPFGRRLAQAVRERRIRITPKQKREWPRRKTHKPPEPPLILTLTAEYKNLMEQHLRAIEKINC